MTEQDTPSSGGGSFREIGRREEGRQHFLAVTKAAEEAVDEVQRYSSDLASALREVRDRLRSMRGMGFPREDFGDFTYLTDKLAEALVARQCLEDLVEALPAKVEAVMAPTTYPKPYGEGTG